jgi:predicted transcriptional regulator
MKKRRLMGAGSICPCCKVTILNKTQLEILKLVNKKFSTSREVSHKLQNGLETVSCRMRRLSEEKLLYRKMTGPNVYKYFLSTKGLITLKAYEH